MSSLSESTNTMKLEDFTQFITLLAERSGEVIRPYFAQASFDVQLKEDRTIVTEADRQAEATMRELIRKTYPAHGILGEEYGSENTSAEFVWTLDPIDGTFSFARGCPLFGTLIGLLHDGKPVLGALHNPVLSQLCIGNNLQTTVNGRIVQLQQVSQLSDAMLLTTDVALIAKHQNEAGFKKLIQCTGSFRTWGDCYGYLIVASGGADIMLDPFMSPWDILPLIPIVQGAKGVITTWTGSDAAQGNSCVVANKILHPRVLEILNT